MFAGLDGKPVAVPMSFKGYKQSLARLEQRRRASVIPGSGDCGREDDRLL